MQEYIIAKKYAKALSSLCSDSEMKEAYLVYAEISQAFSIDKFRTIIASHDITREEKLVLLESLVSIPKGTHIYRLLSILVMNDRISLLPFLVMELKKSIDKRLNVYQAILYTQQALSNDSLLNIQEKLGKKLQVTLQVTQSIRPDIEGIKLEVTDLDIEVAFSKDKFTQELQDFILKAI